MPRPPATADTDRVQAGPGRPRLVQPKRSGSTARDEILDAAAELFTTLGFTATSTRKIADAVGIRQASLYHYFATKDDILAALLDTTVAGSLDQARRLLAVDGPAMDRLLALARLDIEQLVASRWNLGALYLLPEISAERFDDFRRSRTDLAAVY
ncbi:MAG: helix-turn-helix domain-containing protein, partial [Gordonia amarae]